MKPWEMMRRAMMAGNSAPAGGTDDFSTNTLSQYTQYADSPITWTIANGVLSCASGAGNKQSILTRNGVSFANGEASCVITVADDAGLVIRLSNNSNYYVAVIADASSISGSANVVKLFKRVNGTFSQLGTTQTISFTRGVPQTFAIAASGTTISVKLNGTTLISVTDSSHASGLCGPRSNLGNATFDSFSWAPA